jgi:hypothetical protein
VSPPLVIGLVAAAFIAVLIYSAWGARRSRRERNGSDGGGTFVGDGGDDRTHDGGSDGGGDGGGGGD